MNKNDNHFLTDGNLLNSVMFPWPMLSDINNIDSIRKTKTLETINLEEFPRNPENSNFKD